MLCIGCKNGWVQAQQNFPSSACAATAERSPIPRSQTLRNRCDLYWISTLLPREGELPKFAQLYIYDSNPQHQAQLRVNHLHDKLNMNTVLQLQHMMERHNPYVAIYRTTKE